MSDRKALRIVAATASSLGHDPQELILNAESIRQARACYRSQLAAEVKTSFVSDTPLTVHWDGKILPDCDGTRVDRLAIVVSGHGVQKLIGVPKLTRGTGEATASAVAEALDDWGLAERIVAMSFDTTASNTGALAGACTLLEQKLGRRLLSLACRHHVHELVLEKAFSICMKTPSSGPDIGVFNRLKERWVSIDQSQPVPPTPDELPPSLRSKRDSLLQEWVALFSSSHPRDDYKEMLELFIVLLGGEGGIPKVKFRRPGAMHRARWMARAIYAAKITLFAVQLGQLYSSRELSNFRRFTFFVAEVYVTRWFEAPVAAFAPANDLKLVTDLRDFHDAEIGKACMKTFSRHLWYLSEPLVAMSLFDHRLPTAEKKALAEAMQREGSDEPPKRATVSDALLDSSTVASFGSQASSALLDAVGAERAFLSKDPEEWPSDEGFVMASRRVASLRVTNDTAERGVALIQSFNLNLTKNEDQRQYLLQVVERHRQEQPGTSKSSLPRPSGSCIAEAHAEAEVATDSKWHTRLRERKDAC